MRYAIVGLALLLAACATEEGPATQALRAYNTCLDARGVGACTVEKAKLDAAIVYANAQSQRMAAGAAYRPMPPMPVIQTYQPAPESPRWGFGGVICTTNSGVTICN